MQILKFIFHTFQKVVYICKQVTLYWYTRVYTFHCVTWVQWYTGAYKLLQQAAILKFKNALSYTLHYKSASAVGVQPCYTLYH